MLTYFLSLMTSRLIDSLSEIGLSEREAAVYLACLRAPRRRVSEIAREAGIKRTSVYPLLDSLRNKGLLLVEISGFKKYFRAASPERLENLLERKRASFKSILPELKAIYNLDLSESTLRCLQGIEAIKGIYEEILERLRSSDIYWAISNPQSWQKMDSEYFENYKLRRSKKRADVRLLLQKTPAARENLRFQRNLNEEVKLLPDETDLTTNTVVTNWCVLIQQLVTPYTAIVIENPHVIMTQRECFEIIWQALG
ncbi:MAG: hypothetical protein D6719_02475 [Candidatus Dadabacteria bacterium]|nr:MAG: hypothetical protein D6719_02475 [Candidatus Dadabacteria bacterium]